METRIFEGILKTDQVLYVWYCRTSTVIFQDRQMTNSTTIAEVRSVSIQPQNLRHFRCPRATDHMAPRKTRKGNSHDQAHGAQSKRARLESPHDREDHSQSHGDRQASDNEQVGAVMSGPTSQPTMIPWQAILESFEKEPLAPHVQRYKDWRSTYLLELQVDTY